MTDDLNIIPLRPNSKKPLVNWKNFQTIKYDPVLLENHDGNLAAICGPTSNNLLVVDFDFRSGMKRHFHEIVTTFQSTHPELAKTRIVETPHGYHVYYKLQDDTIRKQNYKNAGYNKKGTNGTMLFTGTTKTNFSQYLDGIDLLADGAYVLIPPSIIDGLNYKEVDGQPIKTLDNTQYEKLGAFLLKEQSTTMRPPFIDILNGKIELHDYSKKHDKKEFVYWKYIFIEAYNYASLLPEQLFDGLTKHQPSFDLKKTFAQLKHHSYTDPPLTNAKLQEYFPDYQLHSAPRTTLKQPKVTKPKTPPAPPLWFEIRDQLMEEFDTITLVGERPQKGRIMMMNKGGYYSFDISEFVMRMNEMINQKLDGSKGKISYTNVKTQILSFFNDLNLTSPLKFLDRGWFIPFLNGIYDVKRNVLYLDTSKDYFEYWGRKYESKKYWTVGQNCLDLKDSKYHDKLLFYQIPHLFFPDFEFLVNPVTLISSLFFYKVGHTRFDKAIFSWFGPPINHDDIYELLGYLLTPSNSLKKAFMCYDASAGDKLGDSGKTSFTDVVFSLFNRENVHTISLQELERRFARSELMFKLINWGLDIPSYDIKDTSKLKNWTGDEPVISAEPKFLARMKWRNSCRFGFNANKIPRVKYVDRVFMERFIMYPFPNKFAKKPGWVQRITGNMFEIQMILHGAISGARRLMEHGFRKNIQKKSVETWMLKSDVIYAFINSKECELNPGSETKAHEFTERFNAFAQANNFNTRTQKFLTQHLSQYKIGQVRHRYGKNDELFYTGIKLKENKDDDDKNENKKNNWRLT